MTERLSGEQDASQIGGSVKKKEDTHKMAEAQSFLTLSGS